MLELEVYKKGDYVVREVSCCMIMIMMMMMMSMIPMMMMRKMLTMLMTLILMIMMKKPDEAVFAAMDHGRKLHAGDTSDMTMTT